MGLSLLAKPVFAIQSFHFGLFAESIVELGIGSSTRGTLEGISQITNEVAVLDSWYSQFYIKTKVQANDAVIKLMVRSSDYADKLVCRHEFQSQTYAERTHQYDERRSA